MKTNDVCVMLFMFFSSFMFLGYLLAMMWCGLLLQKSFKQEEINASIRAQEKAAQEQAKQQVQQAVHYPVRPHYYPQMTAEAPSLIDMNSTNLTAQELVEKAEDM